MRARIEQAGLSSQVEIDSAGTAGWHSGKLPDARMREAGSQRGYDLSSRARQVMPEDLSTFDLVLAMDRDNLRELQRLDPQAAARGHVRPFCDFCTTHEAKEVPDPYYGGPEGFEHVLDLLEDGCEGVLGHTRQLLERR